MFFTQKIKFFEVVVVVTALLLGNVLPASGGEAGWLRRGPGQIGPVGRVQVAEAVPARYEDRIVVIAPARTIPEVTESRWVQTSPALPALGTIVTIEVSPGGWTHTLIPAVTETRRTLIADAVPAVYEVRTATTEGRTEWRYIPPLMMDQWLLVADAIPARYEDRVLAAAEGSWQSVWVPPVTTTQRVQVAEAVPARYETQLVEFEPGWWEFTWIPAWTETRWVETSPAVAAQPAVWGSQTITVPGRWEGSWGLEVDEWDNLRIVWVPVWIAPVTETHWVQISPAVAAQPAQGRWETVVMAPARTESRWIPPLFWPVQVLVALAIPARYEDITTVVTPGRWETVWVPTTTEMRMVQVAAAVPARYESRTTVITPGRTIPAVTERRWVQTSPAVAARAAQGGWQNVVVTPARTEVRTTTESFWRESIHGFAAVPMPVTHIIFTTEEWKAGYVVITPGLWETHVTKTMVEIPPVTEWRWVETSPAVAARAAQGEFRDFVVSPAIQVPPVTTTQVVRVAEAIPAQYELRSVPIGTVVERVRVAEAIPARYENHPVEGDSERWDTVWVPPVTTTQSVQVVAAIPARYEDQIIELAPERWNIAYTPPVFHHEWVQTSPNVPAQWGYQTFVVSPAIQVPPVTEVQRVRVAEAIPPRYESLQGSVTVERDREFVLTSLWRPADKNYDMTLTLTYDLNRTVIGITAEHRIDRFQGMGQMFVFPTSWQVRPNNGGATLNFNYTNPGMTTSTLRIWLHFAGEYSLEVAMDIPVNGIVVTQMGNQGLLVLDRASARIGTLGID